MNESILTEIPIEDFIMTYCEKINKIIFISIILGFVLWLIQPIVFKYIDKFVPDYLISIVKFTYTFIGLIFLFIALLFSAFKL